MAFVELEDRTDTVEVVVFPDVWKTSRILLGIDQLIWLKGKIQLQDDRVQLIAEKIGSINHLTQSSSEKSSAAVYIRIHPHLEKPPILLRLKQLLLNHPGSSEVYLYYAKERKTLALSDKYRVQPSSALIKAVEAMMEPGSIRVK